MNKAPTPEECGDLLGPPWDFDQMDRDLTEYCQRHSIDLDALMKRASVHFQGDQLPEPRVFTPAEIDWILNGVEFSDIDAPEPPNSESNSPTEGLH